ncbi:CoA transferase, partial [Vogesella mureinivorans]|uniref:CoA transferase n=1 Tax=Vogesella mureinivorans TaxID=657276 RepID=UPI00197E02CB
VDSALYEAVLQVMESTVADFSASGTKRRRTGSTLPGIAPSNVYPCKDGEYLIGANQDAVFARLAAAMGRPELASDDRYATHRARGARQEELDALIGEWTRTMTIAELEA